MGGSLIQDNKKALLDWKSKGLYSTRSKNIMTDLLTKMQALRSVASKKPDYAKVNGSELIITWDGETHIEMAAELLDLNQDDKVYSSCEISAIYIDGEEIELDCETEQLARELVFNWFLMPNNYMTIEMAKNALVWGDY